MTHKNPVSSVELPENFLFSSIPENREAKNAKRPETGPFLSLLYFINVCAYTIKQFGMSIIFFIYSLNYNQLAQLTRY